MRKGIIVFALVLLAIAAGAYWLTEKSAPPANTREKTAQTQPNKATEKKPGTNKSEEKNPPATKPQTAEAERQPSPAPKGFCERDFGEIAARKADASKLQAAGGLVHIFEREAQLKDPYGCADFYLKHGLAIDAVDPRSDHERLTGLFFAIERNDPKMLRFMIDHGANLNKRAGNNDTKAMGYAYYLALNDTRIDRNKIISILDSTLTRQAGSGGGRDASGANNLQ